MSWNPALPTLTPPLTQIIYRIVQSVKAGTPKIAAIKYELHHGIYPMLSDACNQSLEDDSRTRIDKVIIRQRLTQPKMKARVVSLYLSVIVIDMLKEHGIEVEAGEYDAIVIDEFGEVGEELVRNAMLRAAEVLLTEPTRFLSLPLSEQIIYLRERQLTVMKHLLEICTTMPRLVGSVPEAEALIDRFWDIEERVSDLTGFAR
jgi:hypothetical protein